MKTLVLNISILLLALLGVASCNIKEDMADCQGSMILDYSAYSDEIIGEISDDEQIDVFIFNPNGICCDIHTFTYGSLRAVGFEFELPLTYLNYNAVVWQGLNSADYTSRRMVLGESYDNFYMRLVYDGNDRSCSCLPDPLWATELEPIEYCAKITRHRVYMTRLHTEVDVTVQQKMSDGTVAELDSEDFLLTINATNNVYHTDYEISDESILLEYTNEEAIEDAAEDTGIMTADDEHECSHVGTLRLTPDMDCTLEVESLLGSKVSFGSETQLDLIEYMLATKSDDSLTDQEFLDLNKVWHISVTIEQEASTSNYVAVSLNINGWVIWFTGGGLS